MGSPSGAREAYGRARVRKGVRAALGLLLVPRLCGKGHHGCSLPVGALGPVAEGRTRPGPRARSGPPATHLFLVLLSPFPRWDLTGVCRTNSSWFSFPPSPLDPKSSHAGLPGLISNLT